MAEIRPFRGLRYSRSAGDLSALTAPPYDVLSDSERAEYAAKSPYNIVHLTLPEELPDDRSKFVKYARSAARLAEWRREAILECDVKPTLYRYVQRFSVPDGEGQMERTAIIALLKTEPYESGIVLPHEQTFPKHKEDRLRLLEATRAHLECIYGLCEDAGDFTQAVREAPARMLASFQSPDGVGQELAAVDDPDAADALVRAMKDRRIWIADGHHRYETARAYRESLGEKEGPIAEDYLMMAISGLADPGLVILPTHRIVPHLPFLPSQLDSIFLSHFNVKKLPNGQLMRELKDLAVHGVRAIGVALKGGMGLLLVLEEPSRAATWIVGPQSARLKCLDVSILHGVIFQKLLGLEGTEGLRYTRSAEEALAAVREGADAAFLMNPPTVEDMRVIALGGEKMPQKSTYYYPKLLSGLVLWSLSDFP